ncbi:MAG: T9SS C-terminal target domain-containing protein [Bacteroidetes bacterium]|nr:T9SS C-terminal target domain-containing protein [Bacteroidota bacterium]
MKYFHIIILASLIAILNQSASAQVITFEPSFVTENDSVIVYFDASKGNGELEGFNGQVFLHTGVITNKSTSSTDWKYVPAGWESYPSKLKAEFVSENIWKFTFQPSIRNFFGLTDDNERVEKIAMLFKGTRTLSGAPLNVGRGDNGTDIFLELSKGGVEVKFITPTNNYSLLNKGDSLEILGLGNSTNGSLELNLYKNSDLILSSDTDSINFIYKAETDNISEKFTLIATNEFGVSDTVSTKVIVSPSIQTNLDRPIDTRDGIMHLGNGFSRFTLFAPNKDYSYLIGSFNDWTPSPRYLMNKEYDSNGNVWFWFDLRTDTLEQDFTMQYLVDGKINIADPYSIIVLDEYNDAYIPETSFPNLKPYPTGMTNQAVTLVQRTVDAYEWKTNNYTKPKQDELVIYELLLRDFIEKHNFSTLIDTLNYLDALGINAIELMPISEFDGNESWGYNPSFHYALDKYYGTPTEFKRFVDEAHSRGIMVIIDMVLNHATGQNPYVRLYNGGGDPADAPTPDNPFFYTQGQHPANVFNDMNHFYWGSEMYSKRVMEHWLKEYRVDGFRFDLSKGFTEPGNTNWDNYNPNRVELWKKYADFIWNINPDAYVILEHFGSQQEENELSNYGSNGMMFWVGASVNEHYNEATMGYHDNGKSNLFSVLPQAKNFDRRNLIGYFESHDEQWLMVRNRLYGNQNDGYNIKELEVSLDRMELAGAFFFLLEGPKLIWQFGELGYGYGDNGEQCLLEDSVCSSSAPGRTDNKPIRWDYYNDNDRRDLYNAWSSMINLRNSSRTFSAPNSSYYALSGSTKYFRLSGSDLDVVVIGNFGVNATNNTVDFTRSGKWYDFFDQSSIEVTNNQFDVHLNPGEFKIFLTKYYSSLPISNESIIQEDIYEFELKNNYPNPFNPTTTINFSLSDNAHTTIKVYDLLGREVSILISEYLTSGTHSVNFNAKQLSSGTYIVILRQNNRMRVSKITLVK